MNEHEEDPYVSPHIMDLAKEAEARMSDPDNTSYYKIQYRYNSSPWADFRDIRYTMLDNAMRDLEKARKADLHYVETSMAIFAINAEKADWRIVHVQEMVVMK